MSEPAERRGFALGDLLSLVVTLMLLAWVGKWLADPAVTPLKVARIEGDMRYLKKADLERVVADVTQGGFFTVNVLAVKRAAESLPWVAKASVRRVWPDTLLIRVTEQTPYARWGRQGLVNPGGVVFGSGGTELSQALPQLAGPEGSGRELIERYRYASKVLEPLGMKVAGLELNERGAWSLWTDGGVQVRLGVGGFNRRLERFVMAYPHLTKEAGRRMESVDLRYANGMAVKWVLEAGEKVSRNWVQTTVPDFS
ncbi:MAG: cell division protein FtsQ/DivIB [Gammaproteobacteria bacterium]|nr:cell division protein FtsQ/DivIB [Gammaproteobacteria bacterium]MBU1654213.1 cell division protein FtsQ/DivIB [Gammaproteobacteria bacterium]MBU1960873.1 cell division protein FtsQ/DivIB [Gammaproteobacteria bacterium]